MDLYFFTHITYIKTRLIIFIAVCLQLLVFLLRKQDPATGYKIDSDTKPYPML